MTVDTNSLRYRARITAKREDRFKEHYNVDVQSVSAISVDPRPITSPKADRFMKLLVQRSDNLTGGWSW